MKKQGRRAWRNKEKRKKTDRRIRVVVIAGIGPGIVVRYIKSQMQRSGAGQGD